MLLSDIHSEEPGKERYYSKYLTRLNDSNLLVLAGDIGTFRERDRLKKFLSASVMSYKVVLWVPGNHDYDGGDEDKFNELISEVNSLGFGKLFLLNRRVVRVSIDNHEHIFAGCTLWSNAGKNRSRDRDIHIHPNIRQEMYEKDVKWLERVTVDYDNVIIITHHPPITLSCGELCEYYINSLDHLVEKSRLWLFGHLHKRYEISVNDRILISNPIGRFKDNVFFKPKFIQLS